MEARSNSNYIIVYDKEFEMSNEKYVNYYVEILTNTLTDAVIRNVSLQANAKVSEDVIKNQAASIENLKSLENTVQEHVNTINSLRNEIATLNNFKAENENIKSQLQHIDTFRNELLKCREESQRNLADYENKIKQCSADYENKIKELKEQIEYLQLTPAKRKKIDEQKALLLKKEQEQVIQPKQPKANIVKQNLPTVVVKDGGSF